MLTRIWLGALTVGIALALAGTASAGDDTLNLKLTKSPAAATNDLVPDDRAKADADDDTEDINLRYRLGYNRGYYGGGYIFPRTYAWRAGYYSGNYGYPFRPYVAFRWDYARPLPTRFYYSSGPSYYYTPAYYYSPPIVYSTPLPTINVISGYEPAPAVTIPATPMLDPSPAPSVLPFPSSAQPMPRILPPQPGEPQPKPSKNTGPALGNESRLVKMDAPTKKLNYPAYGEHLRSSSDDTTRLVKK